MPIYHIAEMKQERPNVNPAMIIQSVAGEFMKAGIVTKPEGEGPPLHMHPNEEQFTLVLEGKLHMILGDEDRIVERGDLIHIPRFTPHRSRAVGGRLCSSQSSIPRGAEISIRITTRPREPRRPRRSIRDGEGTPPGLRRLLKLSS